MNVHPRDDHYRRLMRRGPVIPGISRTHSRVAACVISVTLLLPLLLIIAPAPASSEQTITRTPPYDFGCESSIGSDCTLVGASAPCVSVTYSIPPFPTLACRVNVSPQAGIYVNVEELSKVRLSAQIRNKGYVDSLRDMQACFGVRWPDGFTGVGMGCIQLPPVGQRVVMTTEFDECSCRDGFDAGRWGFFVYLAERTFPLIVSGPNLVSVESISVRLTSVGPAPESSPSPSPTSAPDTTPPTQPTGLTAQAQKGNKINLEWNASTETGSGLEGYRIERSSNGSPYGEIATTKTTSYSDKGLKRETTYTYRVIACDKADNCSPPSDPATAMTV